MLLHVLITIPKDTCFQTCKDVFVSWDWPFQCSQSACKGNWFVSETTADSSPELPEFSNSVPSECSSYKQNANKNNNFKMILLRHLNNAIKHGRCSHLFFKSIYFVDTDIHKGRPEYWIAADVQMSSIQQVMLNFNKWFAWTGVHSRKIHDRASSSCQLCWNHSSIFRWIRAGLPDHIGTGYLWISTK